MFVYKILSLINLNKINIYLHQVKLPTGTTVKVAVKVDYVNVLIVPSAKDYKHTKGWCNHICFKNM